MSATAVPETEQNATLRTSAAGQLSFDNMGTS